MDFGLKKLKDFGPKRWRKLEVLKIDNTSNQCDGVTGGYGDGKRPLNTFLV